MKREIKPNIEEDKLGKNPFIEHLKVPVNMLTMPDQWKKDKEGIYNQVEVELEADGYTRVYSDAKRRKQMVELSPRGKDLLLWLFYEVDNAADWVWVNKARYMSECGVASYNTYKSAVRDLIVKGFLQPTVVMHVYWINPHFFFNGSRIGKFPKNVVRR